MASDAVADLMVKISGDASGLRTALKGVQGDIKNLSTNTPIKDPLAVMSKDMSKSTSSINSDIVRTNSSLRTLSMASATTAATTSKSSVTTAKAFSNVSKTATGLNRVETALSGVSNGALKTTGAFGRLGSVFSNDIAMASMLATETSGVSLALIPVAAAAVIVGAAFVLAYATSKTFRDTLSQVAVVAGNLKDHLSTAFDALKKGDVQTAINQIKIGFQETFDSLSKMDWKTIVTNIKNEIVSALNSMNWSEIGQTVSDKISSAAQAVIDNAPWVIAAVVDVAVTIAKVTFDGMESLGKAMEAKGASEFGKGNAGGGLLISAIINAMVVMDPLLFVLNDIIKFLDSIFSVMQCTINTTLTGMWQEIVNFFNTVKEWAGKAINVIVNFLKGGGQELWNIFSGAATTAGKAISIIVNFIKGVGQELWTMFTTAASKAVNVIVNFLKGVGQELWNAFTTAASKIITLTMQTIDNGVAVAKTLLGTILDKVVSLTMQAIDNGWQAAKTLLGSIIDKVVTLTQAAIDNGWQAAKNLLGSIIDKAVTLTMNAIDNGVSAIKGVWDSIFSKSVTLTTNNVSTQSTQAIPGTTPGQMWAEGGIVKAAQGGIVQAAGGYGVLKGPQLILAGEAGDEAFIPLKGGKVPVSINSTGGGGGSVGGSGSSGGGNTYIINLSGLVTQPIDEEQIIKLIKRAELMQGATYG